MWFNVCVCARAGVHIRSPVSVQKNGLKTPFSSHAEDYLLAPSTSAVTLIIDLLLEYLKRNDAQTPFYSTPLPATLLGTLSLHS